MIDGRYKWITAIYWALFFLGELILDFYLMMQVEDIDVYKSTVVEISKKALKNWKIHKIGIMVGLPLAFVAICLYALAMGLEQYSILGMICGAFIGLLIGLREFRQFRFYYKNLCSE